jgi:SAM-dependent methyltransferase
MTMAPKAALRRFAGRSLRHAPQPMKEAIRAAAARLVGILEPPAGNGDALGTPSLIWQSPPLPLPSGVSLADLDATYRSWSVNGAPVGSLDPYVSDSLWRFLYTWDLVRDEVGNCLEIGANPYFTTYLLETYTKLRLTLANFYGQRGQVTESLSFVPPGQGSRVEVEHRSHMFNVEEDPFPFPDDTFDVVLFCETIEHLLMNPVAALTEVHRVLRPSGVLVLTTPNVARLANALSLVEGGNLYDPYSGFGAYGRHNREYTRHELHLVLGFCGFEVEGSKTADGNAWEPRARASYATVAPLLEFRRQDLGQYLFIRARAAGSPKPGLPSFLYRSYPDSEIVRFGEPD